MTVVSMSAKEFSRLDVLMDLEARRVTVRDACGLLRLKRRQVFRLLKGFRQHGAVCLVSKRRGQPGNNRLPASVRDLVMTIIKERYPDFGPTLATDPLPYSFLRHPVSGRDPQKGDDDDRDDEGCGRFGPRLAHAAPAQA